MGRVILEHLVKAYREGSGQEARAVDGISLTVEPGEFMVLVGPSGCGKSTTLRLIAGLEELTAGTISIDGRVVNDVAPKDRDIAMVFQNYALYPHLSVYDNLAFGLRLRKLPKAEIDQRVRAAAALLGLDAFLARKPKALSGGQRQRVAVGRAIVRQPKVFLFDEPLSNLDAKMRTATRGEISRLHARLGATMIYVTHDQVEAMTMGDRICVMRDGRIMQVAEPMALYHRPNHRFVAGFIGSPPMNLFEGRIERRGADWLFLEDRAGAAPGGEGAAGQGETRPGAAELSGAGAPAPLILRLTDELGQMAQDQPGRPVVLGIRPEDVDLAGDGPAGARAGGDGAGVGEAGGEGAARVGAAARAVVTMKLELAETMGAETYLHGSTATGSLVARVRSAGRHELGEAVRLALNLGRAHLFDGATGAALGHAAG
jgi:multiple sugar transport system ATP-binding protein